jgi:cell division cycle 20-like protein 1 (cofactor of APC complex)
MEWLNSDSIVRRYGSSSTSLSSSPPIPSSLSSSLLSSSPLEQRIPIYKVNKNDKRSMENDSIMRRSMPPSFPLSPTGLPMDSPPRRFSSPLGSKNAGETIYSDRFIPSRISSNLEDAFEIMGSEGDNKQNTRNDVAHESQGIMNNLLRSELLGQPLMSLKYDADGGFTSTLPADAGSPSRTSGSGGRSPNVLRYRSLSVATENNNGLNSYEMSPTAFGSKSPSSQITSGSPRKANRKIARTPYKVLDAPSLQDDYYLNLVDWSSTNVLAVALGTSVYLWSACTSKVTKLLDLSSSDDTVTSIAWALPGSLIAVGTNSGNVQIWDAIKCQKVRDLPKHGQRVGSMAWNSTLLASGSRDKCINLYDIRGRGGGGRQEDNHMSDSSLVSRLAAHKQEVCGLKWSFDERMLASGGNDNKLFVWLSQQSDSSTPLYRFDDHCAAVKAVAWSPHQHGLLASGGGTADRHIRFWNALSGAPLHRIDTGSQVCNLMWSKNGNELVSTHGYSLNQIIVWKYPSMQKLTTLTGHTLRVLYLAMSPDGQSVVTGAGDETLRFWNIFPGPRSAIGARVGPSALFPTGQDIR